MTSLQKALLLASAMIVVALGSVFEILPEQAAQFAPLGMLAFLPWATSYKSRSCGPSA